MNPQNISAGPTTTPAVDKTYFSDVYAIQFVNKKGALRKITGHDPQIRTNVSYIIHSKEENNRISFYQFFFHDDDKNERCFLWKPGDTDAIFLTKRAYDDLVAAALNLAGVLKTGGNDEESKFIEEAALKGYEGYQKAVAECMPKFPGPIDVSFAWRAAAVAILEFAKEKQNNQS